jgi:hypothetical protein
MVQWKGRWWACFPDLFRLVPTDQRFGLDLEDRDERQDVIKRPLASNISHDNHMMLWRRRHKCLLISGGSPVDYAPLGYFLRKLKSNGKVSRHLALETFPKAPRFNIFSLEVDAGLMTTYPATLRRASEVLLDLTIQARTPSYDESWSS